MNTKFLIIVLFAWNFQKAFSQNFRLEDVIDFRRSLSNVRPNFNPVRIKPTLSAVTPTFTFFTESYMVHGFPADPGEYPFAVYIEMGGGKARCGGTLLSRDWVLTAAHCVEGRYSPSKIIIGSVHNNKEEDPNAIVRTMKQKCCHKDYDFSTNENDICLIKLSSRVTYGPMIRNIRLPPANSKVPDGKVCTAMGWGLNEKLVLLSTLQEADLKIVNKQQCQSWYSEEGLTIPEHHFCAGHVEGGPDTCGGDSGGPVIIKENGVFVLRGITSFGPVQCGMARRPGVYTRVSSYVSWITEKMNQPCIDYKWSEWTITCSVTCGSGTETRRRRCLDDEGNTVSNSFCTGRSVQYLTCTKSPCTQYKWSEWTLTCSVTCGRGTETRRRRCLDDAGNTVSNSFCSGQSVQYHTCTKSPCKQYKWSEWTITCSVTCGRGTETRRRRCLDDAGNTVSNSFCPGQSVRYLTCVKSPCKEYKWSEWTITCSVTCGSGTETRRRRCSDEAGNTVSNSFCTGQSVQYQTCTKSPCEQYSWSAWDVSCTVTCGTGHQTKSRTCRNSAGLDVEASNCIGSQFETGECHLPDCPKAASYHWSKWKKDCSVTCGSGIERLTRNCLDENDRIVSQFLCTGSSTGQGTCYLNPCPDQYSWSEWDVSCTVTCGRGHETRARKCQDSAGATVPSSNCVGSRFETGTCHLSECPEAPSSLSSSYHWSPWTKECTVQCGSGIEKRTRNCLDRRNNLVSQFNCIGSATSQGTCHRHPCPQNEKYLWSDWDVSCTVTCGEGHETKARKCQNSEGVPVHFRHCSGSPFETGSCHMTKCPEVGSTYDWGDWKDWSSCRVRGNCKGFRSSTRYCYFGNQDVEPSFCMNSIGGDYYQEEPCRPSNC